MALKKAEKKAALKASTMVARTERKKDRLLADKKVGKKGKNLVGKKAGAMVALWVE